MARLLKQSSSICCLVLAILVAPVFSVSACGTGIQIETAPQVLKKDVVAGQVASFEIAVTNKGSVSVEVAPEVVDLAIDEHGYNAEIPEGADYVWGLHAFTKISPALFRLEPGETRTTQVKVAAPETLSGGRYGILYFAASDPSAKGRIIMVVRCGSLLFVTVPGTETYSGAIRDVTFALCQEQANSTGAFEAVFENTGNIHISATGSIRISDGRDTEVNIALQGGTGTVLPGGIRRYRAELTEEIPDGKYKVTVAFMFEGKTVTAQKAFTVKGGQAFFE